MNRFYLSILAVLLCAGGLMAQSGGIYSIRQSAIASGGGASAGGTFSVTGTAAQSVTEQSSQTPFQLRSGFWQTSFAPTADGVALAGQVRTADGRGLRNAIVMITEQSGTIRSTRTGTFGYYRFDDIEAGQTVVVRVVSRRYQFVSRVVSLGEDLADIDFVPLEAEFQKD